MCLDTEKQPFRLVSGKQVFSVEATRALPQQRWVRVTLTLGEGLGRLFLNGELVGEAEGLPKPEDINVTFGYLGRGLRKGYFNGYLGATAVFRTAFQRFEDVPDAASIVAEVKSMRQR